MNKSPAEIYAIQLENSEPSHYTRIPNILKDLTYDHIDESTGEHSIRRLSVNARILYMELKCVAGEYGKCWKNRDGLAEQCNMSIGSITNAKKELSRKFHQLDGGSLISIVKKKKCTMKDQNVISKTDYDEITILNIWNFNNAYMSIRSSLKDRAPSPNDTAGGAMSPNDTAPERAMSPHDTNKSSYNNNPYVEEQQSTSNDDSVAFSSIKKLLPSDEPIQRAITWLESLGFNHSTAKYIARNHSNIELSKASDYLRQQIIKKQKKNQKIPNLCGYLRTILANKYWETQK